MRCADVCERRGQSARVGEISSLGWLYGGRTKMQVALLVDGRRTLPAADGQMVGAPFGHHPLGTAFDCLNSSHSCVR